MDTEQATRIEQKLDVIIERLDRFEQVFGAMAGQFVAGPIGKMLAKALGSGNGNGNGG